MADGEGSDIVDWFQDFLADDSGPSLPDEGDPLFPSEPAADQRPTSGGNLQDAPLSPLLLSAATSPTPLHHPASHVGAAPIAHIPLTAIQSLRGDGGYTLFSRQPTQAGEGVPPATATNGFLHHGGAISNQQPAENDPQAVDHSSRGLQAGSRGAGDYQYGQIERLLEWEWAGRQPGSSGVARGAAQQRSGYRHGTRALRFDDGTQALHPDNGTQALHFDEPVPRSAGPLATDMPGRVVTSLPSNPSPWNRPRTVATGGPLPRSRAGPSSAGGSAIHRMDRLPRMQATPSSFPEARGSRNGNTALRPQTEPMPSARPPALILEDARAEGGAADAAARSKRARVEAFPGTEALDMSTGGVRRGAAGRDMTVEGYGAGIEQERLAGEEEEWVSAQRGRPPMPRDRSGEQIAAGTEEAHRHKVAWEEPPGYAVEYEQPTEEVIEWQAKREKFGNLMTQNLLRMATCSEAHGGVSNSSVEATAASLRTEKANLRVARQATMMRIQQLQHLLQVQEDTEMSVRRLLDNLEQQRARNRQGGLGGDLTDVLRIVQHLNAMCRTGPHGPNHYLTSSYASKCRALPLLCGGEEEGDPCASWLTKRDVTSRYSVMECALAFADGDHAAGEVEMVVAGPAGFRQSLVLKEIPALSSPAYHQLTMAMFSALLQLVHEVQAEGEGPARQQLLLQLHLALTEFQAIDHVYFVFNPLHYRRQEHWMLLNESASLRRGREAALTRALESLRRTGSDLQGLRALWEGRRSKLKPIQSETKRVRGRIGRMFAELSAKPAHEKIDYSDYSGLMAAVAELKRCVDDANVLLSVTISAGNLCVLTSYQMALAISAAYPHIISQEQMLANAGILA